DEQLIRGPAKPLPRLRHGARRVDLVPLLAQPMADEARHLGLVLHKEEARGARFRCPLCALRLLAGGHVSLPTPTSTRQRRSSMLTGGMNYEKQFMNEKS